MLTKHRVDFVLGCELPAPPKWPGWVAVWGCQSAYSSVVLWAGCTFHLVLVSLRCGAGTKTNQILRWHHSWWEAVSCPGGADSNWGVYRWWLVTLVGSELVTVCGVAWWISAVHVFTPAPKQCVLANWTFPCLHHYAFCLRFLGGGTPPQQAALYVFIFVCIKKKNWCMHARCAHKRRKMCARTLFLLSGAS